MTGGGVEHAGVPGGGSSSRLRAQLGAVGSVLGVPLIATDDAEWRFDDGSPGNCALRVGLGWYAERGYREPEAVALAMLHLWEGVRAERAAPDRSRRRRTLGRVRPEADPLLGTVLRLQCAAELTVFMPGVRGPLATGLRRALPDAVGELPRHLQWVALLIARWQDRSAAIPGLDPAVRDEWLAVSALAGAGAESDGGTEGGGLYRVLAPNPARPPLRSFERALALLLPPYERLLALDAAGRGPAVPGGRSAEGPEGDPDPEHADADELFSASGDSAPEEGQSERARAGGSRDSAEGADLFAAEHAAFVGTILPTPMPAEGALFEAAIELAARASGARRAGETAIASVAGGAAAAASTARTGLAAYRERADALAEPIERMREVWARIIAERVDRRPRMGRRAHPEGEELVAESLATAVADAEAGVARPSAYRRREARPRRTRRAGSTDYALLIDRSASMTGPAAEAAADAALIMLEALAGVERDAAHAEARAGVPLELDIRTALIVFDGEAHVVKPLSGGLDDGARRALHAAVRAPRGATNDGAALAAAAEQFGLGSAVGTAVDAGARGGRASARPSDGLERRRIAILISDGGSNDPAAASRELRRLRRAGVRVHAIGLGDDEIVDRYAPTSRRLDDPRGIAEALHRLVENELP
ncbi:MAG: VWA domain-containing protein [Leucobacter sp.]